MEISEVIGGASAPDEKLQTGESVEQTDTASPAVSRDEQGRFVSPKDVQPETVVEPARAEPAKTEDDQTIPRAALIEERRKRQQLEAELATLRQKPEQPTDFWTDPEKAISERMAEMQRDYTARYYNALEAAARSRHQDYDEVRAVFVDEAQRNPALAAQLQQVEDPAEFAYRQGKLLRELRTVNGDFDAYKAKLRADLETEIRQKLAAEMAKAQAPQVPRSLNAEPSSPVSGNGAWAPTPLGSIVGHKF